MPLLNADDLEELPKDKFGKWFAIRDLLDKRISELDNQNEGLSQGDYVEYCSILESAAKGLGRHFGIFEERFETVYDRYSATRGMAGHLTAELIFEGNQEDDTTSLTTLSQNAQASIQDEVQIIREILLEWDCSDTKKRKISSAVDKLENAVVSGTIDLSQTLKVVGLCAATISTTAAASAHFAQSLTQSILNISEIAALQAEANEEKRLLLESPNAPVQITVRPKLRQLPAPE